MQADNGNKQIRKGVGPRRANDPWRALRRCAAWAQPIFPILIFGAACSLGSVYLGQQPPRLYQYTIDTIIGQARYHELWRMIALYAGILITGQMIEALSRFWMTVAGQRLLHDLRMRLYDHLQLLPLAYFDNRRVGDLMTRITGDVRQVESLILHTTNALVRQLFGMGFALYYMLGYSPLLTLLVLVPVPLLTVGVVVISRRMRLCYRAIREAMGLLGAKLQENLSGIRVIQAFHRETLEHERVNRASLDVVECNVEATRISSVFYPVLHLIGASGAVVVLGAGTYLISRNIMTVGTLTAFSMYIAHFYRPINEFVHTFDTVQRTLAAGERIFDVLDTVPEIRDPEQPLPLPAPRGEVEFQQVSFRYETGDIVLQDLSVHVRPGECLALAGRSGAGKTSFVNLIARFYDVTGGCVRVDGLDVRQVRVPDLRRRMAFVLQDTFLFDGTVLDNLRYGCLEADEETVREAAIMANAHEFITRLPEGYETPIGERGIKLSGGQKQRLSIARAVLADPRILILDEATSSVDGESERLIHQALERLMRGRTTFIIAHRLSTVRKADRILVLDAGRIIEQGTHDALVAANGRYAEMIRKQAEGETVDLG